MPYAGGTRAISPRELGPEWGSRSALGYDDGADGQGVTPPIGWLEDYWMGRYYGFIEPPRSQVSEPPSATPRGMKPRGVSPYNSPMRPAAPWER